jgi:hypothetical protein
MNFANPLPEPSRQADSHSSLAGQCWDAKGDWTRAHESVQQDEGVEGSWVHAYLHRKEGDESNAAYWYNRGGQCGRQATESLL